MGSRRGGIINIKNEVIIGRIYKITNKIDDMVYVGSTVKTLCKRLGDHMYDYKKGTNMKLYEHFRQIGVENFEMELLEWKQVKNMNELHRLEQDWMEKENPKNLLNSRSATKE